MKQNKKMQENQLNPNEQTNSENPQDLLNASLIFARAYDLLVFSNGPVNKYSSFIGC